MWVGSGQEIEHRANMESINKRLVPIKAHYFFFMAAMGPILPQVNVFGKELGVSPDVMGLITSILPIMYILAKPAVGYLIDAFPNVRKVIFMSIVSMMIACFAGFYFLPPIEVRQVPAQSFTMLDVDGVCDDHMLSKAVDICSSDYRMIDCSIKCDSSHTNSTYGGLIHASTLLGENKTKAANDMQLCLNITLDEYGRFRGESCRMLCAATPIGSQSEQDCFYKSATFWLFVTFACLGIIAFNVSNCVSDAACFDLLGDQTMAYGAQRVWGTIGFGISALLSGVLMHFYASENGASNAIGAMTPALVIMIGFSVFDLISIKWLELPQFSSDGDTIASKVTDLLMQKQILLFLVFVTLVGVFDSFIIYYMFWYLEEVAARSGFTASIKLIEGCVVAAECLGGEILFFLISGRILKRIGYSKCLSFCFAMYALRLYLISIITNPWWLVLVELFMQGSSYALCYTCIVAYASAISPPGTTATVQGLVAGMDDGVGFAIGSLIGGQMYKRLGGSLSFRLLSGCALLTCITHIFLRPADKFSRVIEQSEMEENKLTANESPIKFVKSLQ